jgi:hypothetical protein
MPAISINCLAVVLKELGWSYTKLIAELRRHAAVDRVVLPKTESLIHLISRWVNNHQQPDDFYRDLLSRATGSHASSCSATRQRWSSLGPTRALGLLQASLSGLMRICIVANCFSGWPPWAPLWRQTRSSPRQVRRRELAMP